MNTPLNRPRCHALVPAAGAGLRFGHEVPKQYLKLLDRPLIAHALARLASHPRIESVVVVLAAGDDWFDRQDWRALADRLRVLRCGGASRAETVRNGLRALADTCCEDDWVLVHDAARPCLPAGVLDRMIAELADDPVGGIAALPVPDTLKRADDESRVAATVSREGLWAAQTPQMFRYGLLERALGVPNASAFTDEASAVEALGLRPRLVRGDPVNIKVTYPGDLALAGLFLEAARAARSSS
ncbi:MAG: 2-C-methyl-D-erythritol 4-phosphate cytidylyltransferase [Betaproteobacteria bacterium]|nr:2-C-methyl-D-erythritol 4-phosphate cytidylyltransferase [Betaproteobacteria bacterium]